MPLARITEAGCLAHARRKFFELQSQNQSLIADEALDYLGQLYQIEREAAVLPPEERQHLRQTQAKPIGETLTVNKLNACIPRQP